MSFVATLHCCRVGLISKVRPLFCQVPYPLVISIALVFSTNLQVSDLNTSCINISLEVFLGTRTIRISQPEGSNSDQAQYNDCGFSYNQNLTFSTQILNELLQIPMRYHITEYTSTGILTSHPSMYHFWYHLRSRLTPRRWTLRRNS